FGELFNKRDRTFKKNSSSAVDVGHESCQQRLTDKQTLPFPTIHDKSSGILKQGRKSVKRKSNDSDFESFVRELAKEVTEGLTLSQETVVDVEYIVTRIFDAIVNKAMRPKVSGDKKILTITNLRMAIEMILPPKLANMAIYNASWVVSKKYKLTYG
ncbi:hypothetical protein TNCT_94701, partial [Trichonephila clavata]